MNTRAQDLERLLAIRAARDQQRDEAEANYAAELLAIEEEYEKALYDAGLEDNAEDEE